MILNSASFIVLVPHEIRPDKKNYIVEDKSSGEFYEMPEICIDAIHLINDGLQLGDIERDLKGKYPDEDVDLVDFANQLFELQLIAEIDGVKVEEQEVKKESLGFRWISPKLGKLFFNKAAYFVYGALFIINVFFFIWKPSLFPQYKDLFIFNLMALNIPAWLILSFGLVLIHEYGHVLALRSHDLPTKLEIGHRLFIVVFETDMSSVWRIPSKDRNVLFLAGLCFDTVILFISLSSQIVFVNGSGIFLSIMNVVVLTTFIRMVYQLGVYMKTDLYHVFENVSGCYNLMENAQQMIRKWLPFLQSSSQNEVVFEEEKRTIFFYTIFYFVGVVLSISLFVFYYIPQLLFALKKSLPGFLEGPASLPFWDSALFLLQLFISVALLLYSWRKKYARASS